GRSKATDAAGCAPSPACEGGRGGGSPEHGASGFPVSGSPPQAGERAQAPLTWLALEPVTGRTHQLRVHCAAKGWPIVGDDIYGKAARFHGPVLHLHAREVVVPISKNRPAVRVVAPVPTHMRESLTACGWNGEDQ